MRVEEGRVPFRGHHTWYRSVGDGPGVVFEESADTVPIEEPERYPATVRAFLARVESGL